MTKRLFIPFVLLLSLFFVSCEKEFSTETGGTPGTGPVGGGALGGTAQYSLNGGTGVCAGATTSGTFTVGAATTASNTVTLQVIVDSIGTYSVNSNTVNGITFSGSGTFTSEGIQEITLQASGTPVAAGTFSVPFGSTGCTFSITVVDLSSTPSVFTLGGSPAACTGFSLGGVYTAGSVATASNSVSFEVSVTTPGTYSISSNTVNGISFSGSGLFSAAGNQSVTLTATGTPAAAGSSDFSVTAGTSTCTFSVPVIAPAAFTLAGAPGSCTPATVAGTYENGTALSTANTITIDVDVTSIGGYSLSTNTVNGMTFSTSGNFTTTGPQNIILTGSGTPAASGTFTFTPQIGTSGCTFDIVVTAAPIPSGTYSCKVDGVLLNFTDRAKADIFEELLSQPYLYLDGYTAPPNGSNIPELQIFIEKNDASAVGVGSYNENSIAVFNGYRIEIDYHEVQADESVIIWNTSSTILPPANPPFIINVTEVSATRVRGTFSGQLKNTLNTTDTRIRNVTEGVFDLPIQ